MMVNRDIRIYVMHMTLNKNGKVIFATRDKFSPLNYHKTLNSPFFVPPLKFQKKIPPTNMSCWKSWFPPTFTRWGREKTMKMFD